MTAFSRRRSVVGWLTIGGGVAAAAYAMYGAATWLRYGHAPRSTRDNEDPLLDQFIPRYDVVERHHVDLVELAVARTRGYRRLSLETGTTAEFEPAQALYRQLGFTYCGAFGDYREHPLSRFMSRPL